MQYAIELYYDKKAEQKLFNLAQRVADEKLSTKFLEWKTRPHLTLVCFNDIDETKCITILKKFASERKILPAYPVLYRFCKSTSLHPLTSRNKNNITAPPAL